MTNDKDARVLMIEDNVANFVAFDRMCRYLGIKPDWATTPFSALELLKENKYDLVIMDKRLPYQDGYATLPIIRSIAGLEHIKVWLCTADVTEDEVNQAKQAGFDGFMAKPVDPDEFPSAIMYILSGGSIPDCVLLIKANCSFSSEESGYFNYFRFE